MEESDFLGELFDRKLVSIISLFLENKNSDFYLREIAHKCGVSPATTHRLLKKLCDLRVLKLRQINRFKFYRLESNERVELLERIISKDPLQRFVAIASKLPGLHSILLYGDRKPDSANVLLIGNGIQERDAEAIASSIRQEFGFNVKHLSFGVEQFEQMVAMGLYAQGKKVLWKTI